SWSRPTRAPAPSIGLPSARPPPASAPPTASARVSSRSSAIDRLTGSAARGILGPLHHHHHHNTRNEAMKYAQFYQASAVDPSKLVEAVGDRSVIIFDGRLGV